MTAKPKGGFGFVIAPKELVEKRKKIRFMYREQPDNMADSGWRFFSGDETDEEVNDPSNIALYDVKTILAIDADVMPYLNRAYYCAFERERTDEPFAEVHDFFE